MPPAPIRRVQISDPDEPGTVIILTLRWVCPVADCRRPRGEPTLERLVYHDAAGRPFTSARVHRWRNPCGHLQEGPALVDESDALVVQQAIARGLKTRGNVTVSG